MRPCIVPNCPTLTERTRCAQHQQQRERERRPTTAYPHAYRMARLRVLERDGYQCRYCGGYATTADHVIPVAHGGTDDDANLVACCSKCNSSRGSQVRR